MENELRQLKRELEELRKWKASLEMSHSIPLNIDQAFRQRLSDLSTELVVSSKAAASENQAVNEGGAATYSVLKPPDAFIAITIGGVNYYLPAFT